MLDFQQQALRAETSIIAAIQDVFPFKGQVNTIIADKVWIEHEKGARTDFAGQKDKKIKGGTWASPIYANLRLINNETGKVIDKTQKVRLVNLPLATPRGSYIVSGSEYQVPNQLRLLPGVYTRIQENGELESQVNLAKGMNFKIFIDPRTQVFQMKFGTATIQLYHVLTALGASRSQIEAVWGSEITEINSTKGSQDTEVSKLYKSIFRQEQPDVPTATADISTYFSGNVIDKETTKKTLGKAFSNVNPDMLLQISAKILAVSRGEKKADDRDSLEFKSIYSVDDFLRERIEKNAWKIKGSIRRNIDRKERIRDIIGISTFNRPIQSFFTLGDTGLSSTTEQTNPLHMISETDKIILTGAGGITNPYQVTLEARAVHPSSLGFIDPIATPESSRIGTTLHLPLGAEKRGNKLFTSVYEVKTGKVTQISSTEAANSVLSFRDQYVVRAGKLKPKSKTVKASNKGKISLVPASEVQYIIPTAYSLFSVQSNMIPFLPSNQGNRAMMAGKMMTQALPLQNREKPNVQVIAGKDMTFENIIGEQFSFKSPVAGAVESITEDIITIKDRQGKRHEVSVYGNFPLNSKTSFINSEARVAVGDKVRKGQLLADTNYTRDGELALGVNAHVAYLPYKGYNFEDGIVISEGFAKRLTSEHLYKITLSVDPNTVMDLDKFRAYYPEAIDLASASKLDKTGVIKKGQTVRFGDVVMAVLKKEEKSPEDIILAKLHRAFIKPYKNRSISWDEEDEGTIVDIFRTPKKIEVHIRTLEPAKIGDKLAARHANKGTITHIANQNEMPTTKDGRVIDIMINPHCYDDQTEVLIKDKGWILFSMVEVGDSCATLNPKTHEFEWDRVDEVIHAPYTGKMYKIKNRKIDLVVTPNHKMYTRKWKKGEWELKAAEGIFGERRAYKKNAKWTGGSPSTFEIAGEEIDAETWCKFAGWFVSEGWVYHAKANYSYRVGLNQSIDINPDNVKTIDEIIDQLPWKFTRTIDNGMITWVSSRKEFYFYMLEEFGKGAANKMIPQYIKDCNKDLLSVFLNAYMAGDGNEYINEETGHYGTTVAWTKSNRLAGDLQEIACKLGTCASVNQDKRDGINYINIHRPIPESWVNWSDATKNNQIEEWIDYDGSVHCVTVSNHIVYVRRNGTAVWSGNSVPSRINPSQILETVAGKIAEKQGRQFEVRNFSGEDYTSTINTAMNKARVQDKEDLIDPTTNRTIPGVLVGSQYMLKLDHPTRKKFSARAQGPGYTIDLQPSRGKHTGGQRLDTLTLYSMLAHGAKHNLREMATWKSEKNDEVWRALQLGQALPTPQTPFAFEKFVGMIKGLGVDVKKEGNDLVLMPMTDRQIRDASFGEIKNSQVVRGKDFRPETGGLFDPKITGGLQGDKWNHIELAEALPNPIFENAIKSILGITQTIYDDLIAGRRFVTKDGKMTLDGDGNLSGGEAVKKLLSKVNIDRKISDLIKQAKGKKGSDLDKIHKTIRYLTALKTYGMKPSDYVVKRIPVIPARLRPVYALSDGELDVTEVNYMYKDLIDINTQLKDFEDLGMPDEEKAKLRETVYKGMKAVAGLHPHLGGRNYKGIIEQIKGNTNKEGFFQNRIMSRRQEFTGRSTIVPEPSLGLDDVAIPEEMAWKTHQVFIVRELIRQGYKPIDAREQVEKRTPLAKRALEIALEDRPVLLNRAPSLHKFSIMAFIPQLTSGKAIKINPLIVKGFNADFDGDTMAVHVPITEEARLEAWRMLPSRNLYSPRTNELMHTPTQEAITGLYLLTQTPQGRSRINSILPDKKYHITTPMTGNSMAALLKRISKESPGQFVKVVNAFKDFGNQSAYQMGFTVGLEDLIIDRKFRDKIFQEAERKVGKAKDKNKAIVDAYMEASGKLDDALKANKRLRANGFMIMANSGAKGNIAQIRQILAAPVLVRDIHNRTVPVPITKSYAEGLDTADYWATMSGARKGMIDRALQTSEPGALAKELLNTTVGHIISEEDCGTIQGIQLSIGSIDILDRYLSSYAKGVGTRNTLVTPAVLKKARIAGLEVLNVRSPLTCESARGTCRKCFGIDERGKLIDIGTNIGVIAGQSIAEPATQLTMRTFHTGAAAEGGNITAGFQRVKDLLNMPKILRGKATLAQEDGKIDDVKDSPLGGWDIFINKNKHRVPKERTLLVKKGDQLKKGDPLSDGVWHPEELVRLKGMRAAQDYLSNEIQREYLDQGVYIKRKIIESVVKPMTNTVRILDPGQHPTYIPGDHAPYNTVERWNRDQKDEFSRVIAEPMLRGINTAPLMSEDWIQRLNFQRLENTLLEGPSQAWRSPISSPYSPLSAYAYGSEIGKEE